MRNHCPHPVTQASPFKSVATCQLTPQPAAIGISHDSVYRSQYPYPFLMQQHLQALLYSQLQALSPNLSSLLPHYQQDNKLHSYGINALAYIVEF